MVIETREYRNDMAVFTRASYRTVYARLWPMQLVGLFTAIGLCALGNIPLGLFFLVFIALLPVIIVQRAISRLKTSPLSHALWVTRFDDQSMEQLFEGERRTYLKYVEMHSADLIPEGLRIWIVKNARWTMIPKEAFQTPEDMETTCDLLRSAGLMRAPK